MIGRVDFDGGALFLDHTGLYELETKHGIEPEALFTAVMKPSGLRAVFGVALERAKARGLTEQVCDVGAVLDGLPHQDAARLAVRCVHLSVFGREPDDESAEGEAAAPESGSAGA